MGAMKLDFDELLYDEIYAENSPRLAHCEYSTEFLEIFVTRVRLIRISHQNRHVKAKKDQDTAPSFHAEVIPPGALKDWVAGREVPELIYGRDFAGGLRLLCQVWKPTDRMSADKYTLPFKDEDTLREVLAKFHLPQCYPHDLVRRRYIPVHAHPIFGAGENRTAIVCQSPDYTNLFMTIALSYDPCTRITSGFIGGEVDSSGQGPITKLLSQLRKVFACAIQPMLLPVIAYSIWCDRLRIHVRDAAMDIHKIQKKTGLMDAYMKNSTQIAIAKASSGEYNSIHEELVQAHASLTNDLSRFVEDLGLRCKQGLDLFYQSALENPLNTDDQINTSEAALRSYLDHWQLTANVALQQRDQQLARANRQLQVLYNPTQQRVAEEQRLVAQETKRDSNAMKSIALLTMIFLPSTALATIFSMSSFFTLDTESSRLLVSSDFWIFWAIAIPLTALVIIIWTLWIQRTEVMNIWKRRKHAWQEQERRRREKANDEEKANEAVGRMTHKDRITDLREFTEEYTKLPAGTTHLNLQIPQEAVVRSTNRTSSSQAISPPPLADEAQLTQRRPREVAAPSLDDSEVIFGNPQPLANAQTYIPQQIRPEAPIHIRITDAINFTPEQDDYGYCYLKKF
ncbi:hypothetical protein MMC30_003657 [Trapelia coarctata]|nr:hypothetical protein [Trapelia coarctata]